MLSGLSPLRIVLASIAKASPLFPPAKLSRAVSHDDHFFVQQHMNQLQIAIDQDTTASFTTSGTLALRADKTAKQILSSANDRGTAAKRGMFYRKEPTKIVVFLD